MRQLADVKSIQRRIKRTSICVDQDSGDELKMEGISGFFPSGRGKSIDLLISRIYMSIERNYFALLSVIYN